MSKDYDIGYGKPPEAHRFQKGQSGNPAGSRSTKGFDKLEIIEAIYSEKVAITIDGKRKKVSKFEAAARMTVHTAMQKGDIRSFERVMKLIEDQGGNWRQRWAEEARAGAEAVMTKISKTFDRLLTDVDPDKKRRDQEEMDRIMSCDCCGPYLRGRWTNDREDLSKWSQIRIAHYTCDRRLQRSSSDNEEDEET